MNRKVCKLPDGLLFHPQALNEHAKRGQRLSKFDGIATNTVYEVVKVLDKNEYGFHMVMVKKIRGQRKSGFQLDVKEAYPITDFDIA